MGSTVTIIISSVITIIRGVSILTSLSAPGRAGPRNFTSGAFYSSSLGYASSKSMNLNHQKYDFGSAG